MTIGQTPTVSEVRQAQSRAVGGKKDRCVKGKSCSATCIDPNETCLVEFPSPISDSISKARDNINPSREEESLSEEGLKVVQRMKEKFKEDRYKEIRRAISYKDEIQYNKLRKEIIEFNNNLAEGGAKSLSPIKVPIEWSKVEKIRAAYLKAYYKVSYNAEKAGYTGNKEAFDREVGKLKRMHETLGSKLGTADDSKFYKWGDYQENNLINRLFKADMKGVKIMAFDEYVLLDSKVGKHSVRVELLNRGTKFTFKVNGGYDEDPDMTRKEKLAIAYRVKDMFSQVVKNMDEGSVIEVAPYTTDGKGEGRRKAYRAYGFLDEPSSGDMLGIVRKGKLQGATLDDLENFIDNDKYNFSEKNEVALFYQMLWGEPPSQSR